MSMVAAGFLSRAPGGELLACFGIDIQAARPAPAGKLPRVDVRLDGDDALAAEAFFRLLGIEAPRVPGGGQPVPVVHDGTDLGVVVLEVPGDADGAHG